MSEIPEVFAIFEQKLAHVLSFTLREKGQKKAIEDLLVYFSGIVERASKAESRIAELTERIGSQMADVYTLKARIAELEAERLELRKTLGWAYDLDEYKDNPEVQKCTTNSIKLNGAKMKFTEDFIKEQLDVMEKFEKADCSLSPEYIAGRNAAIQNYPDALRKILLLEHEIRSWCKDMSTVFDDGEKRVIEAERNAANLRKVIAKQQLKIQRQAENISTLFHLYTSGERSQAHKRLREKYKSLKKTYRVLQERE